MVITWLFIRLAQLAWVKTSIWGSAPGPQEPVRKDKEINANLAGVAVGLTVVEIVATWQGGLVFAQTQVTCSGSRDHVPLQSCFHVPRPIGVKAT